MHLYFFFEMDDLVPNLLLRLIWDKYDVKDFASLFREEDLNTFGRFEIGYRIAEFVEIVIRYTKGFVFDMASFDRLCQAGPAACNRYNSQQAASGEYAALLPFLTPSKNQSVTLETRVTF